MDRQTFKKHLAANLRDARLKTGKSQAEIAEAAGMERSHVSHFESGRRSPDVYSLVAIASALRTSIKNLLPNAK